MRRYFSQMGQAFNVTRSLLQHCSSPDNPARVWHGKRVQIKLLWQLEKKKKKSYCVCWITGYELLETCCTFEGNKYSVNVESFPHLTKWATWAEWRQVASFILFCFLRRCTWDSFSSVKPQNGHMDKKRCSRASTDITQLDYIGSL